MNFSLPFRLTLLLILFLGSVISIFPQQYSLVNSFGNFKSASSFYITTAGIIYITDSGTDEIYKLDTLGNVLKYAGGFGWDGGLFDNPSDVYANPLSVYVCDKNNHRIERFDKDLNFIWQLYTRNSDTTNQRFGYPLGCTVSQQGDLFILDSENKRVVKFDLFGNFVQNFGGYDAGAYALVNPQKLAASLDNDIYVTDQGGIVEFDQYGNGISIIKFDTLLSGLHIFFNMMTANNDNEIFFANLNSSEPSFNKVTLTGTKNPFSIVTSIIYNDKLYVLTKTDINVFARLN